MLLSSRLDGQAAASSAQASAEPAAAPVAAGSAGEDAAAPAASAPPGRPPGSSWDRWAAVDFEAALRNPATTLKEPPRWFRGSLQRAYAVALEEWGRSKSAASWLLLLFTPQLLLSPIKAKGMGTIEN